MTAPFLYGKSFFKLYTMKITPLEIRQKTFEKNFRGYEKDEVHAFLLTLSQEWERTMDENKELRIKLEAAEREVGKLREVENSLFRTLKTAEDTGANVIDQSRKAAELHLKESQLRAEAMLNEAKSKAKDTIEESETRAKQVVVEMEERLKSLVDNYKKLESTREDLLGDLKRIASDIMDRVERVRQSSKDFDAERHLNTVRREAKKIIYPNYDSEKPFRQEIKPAETTPTNNESVLEHQVVEAEAPVRKTQKSFFDEIG
jgi:cell division initiation protein